MAEASDKARIRLARLRCLLSCLQAIRKGETCNSAICFVPKSQKLEYTSSQPLSVFSKPSKESSIVGEIGGSGKRADLSLKGLPLAKKEGIWVCLANPLDGWCVIEEQSSKEASAFKLGNAPEKTASPWMEAIDNSFGFNLSSSEEVAREPDEEWTKKLSLPPESWSVDVDKEVVKFLVESYDKKESGGVAQLGEHCSKIEVSSNDSDISQLTDGMEDTYWESNGQVGQHWIRLHIKPGLVMDQITLKIDLEDDSFLPKNVVLKVIDESGHKQEMFRRSFGDEDYITGELKVLTSPLSQFHPKIEVCIKSCNSGGFDTRIHGIQTSARGMAVLFNTTDLVSGLVSADSLAHYPALQTLSPESLQCRCVLMKRLSTLLDENILHLLPQWEFSIYTTDYLSLVKQLLPLCPARQSFILEALQTSASSKSGGTPTLHINRFLAAEHRENPSKDHEGKNTVFNQVYKGLSSRLQKGRFTLRWAGRSSQWWEVKFAKEHIIDQGGGFRDSLTDLAEELCPPASEAEVPLPFFIRSPNQAQDSSNIYRDVFVPNPSCHDYARYRFIGMLMGGAYRSSECLVLALPKFFWKQVVGEPVEWSEDFPSVDSGEVKFIDSLKSMTEGDFNAAFSDTLTYTTVLSNGEMVTLVPNGEKKGVCYEDRMEFCRLVKEKRINESIKQTESIIEGFVSVVPREVLALHTWKEVETKVCGNPEITVEALKRHTIYESDTKPKDARVETMWKALERFTNEERGQFLRFITGRRRLPCSVFIQSMRETNCLPRAATCSNCLYLPDYTAVDIAYKKLLFAAYNCIAIDTDG
jgi:E3 ubiquitin-protein ligase HECTD3